ncbi:MAG TPA: GAF domain-containing protein [Gemmatimonadales bacterium]|nr:GAF domain-containing protein [Gemmatimonadales bacterium]
MTMGRALPLIPLIRAEESARDPLVLATWHAALSNALGVELPHTLLALWLYPARGTVQLLAPEELAQDNLAVPVPNPNLSEAQLASVAEVVRRAYASVLCLPIRFGRRDVGLLLMADLAPERYKEPERAVATQVAAALAPTFAKLARRWVPGGGERDFVAAVTAAWGEAKSPREFFRLVSQALDPELPHDLFEVFIPAPGPGDQYRLAGHAGPPPWADPTLVVSRDRIDLASLFAGESVVRLSDAPAHAAWPGSVFADDIPPGQSIRSVLATRIMAGGHLAAHLVVGSTVADLYHADDADLIQDLGRLLAPQVEAYVLASQMHVLRKQLGALRSGPTHRARVADMFATTPKLADATRRLAEEVKAMVPCDRLVIAVRMSDGDRVAFIEPGDARHLADIPLRPVAGSALEQVLRHELADAVTESPKQTELIVPLRAAGRTVGALVITARGFGAIGRDDVAQLQQLADIVAPYVELARRIALMPALHSLGWKQTAP